MPALSLHHRMAPQQLKQLAEAQAYIILHLRFPLNFTVYYGERK